MHDEGSLLLLATRTPADERRPDRDCRARRAGASLAQPAPKARLGVPPRPARPRSPRRRPRHVGRRTSGPGLIGAAAPRCRADLPIIVLADRRLGRGRGRGDARRRRAISSSSRSRPTGCSPRSTATDRRKRSRRACARSPKRSPRPLASRKSSAPRPISAPRSPSPPRPRAPASRS